MFLYFLPDVKVATREAIAKHGLAYAFDNSAGSSREVMGSPAKKPGVIATRAGTQPPDRQAYVANKQTWRKVPNSEVWVGRWDDQTIRPEDLLRPEHVDGPRVLLADDCHWQVAQARKFLQLETGATYVASLPHDLDLDDQGRWMRSKVSKPYSELSRMAEAYWETMIAAITQEKSTFVFDELDALCVASLRANYYVSDVELALLGAYSIQSREAILSAVLDLAFARNMLEKKTDGAQNGSGLPDGIELGETA